MKVDQSNWKFKIRDIVKEDIAGFTGVIQAVSHLETGCTHYGIAPNKLDKTGQIQGWCWFDESRLIKTGHSKGFSPESWDQQFNMHDVLKDIRSGFIGCVTSINFYATGCITYELLSTKLDRDGKLVDTQNIGQESLVLVKSTPAKKVPKARPAKAEKPPSPPCELGARRTTSFQRRR